MSCRMAVGEEMALNVSYEKRYGPLPTPLGTWGQEQKKLVRRGGRVSSSVVFEIALAACTAAELAQNGGAI